MLARSALLSLLVAVSPLQTLAYPNNIQSPQPNQVEAPQPDPVAPALLPRTTHCSNDGLIKRVKPEYKGKCNPKDSLGWKGAHNCTRGKSYLCVQGGVATCMTISAAQKAGLHNGECFK